MNMETGGPQDGQNDGYNDGHIEPQPHGNGVESEATFAVGPEETVLSCTDRRATEMQPEANEQIQEAEPRPIASTTVHERLVLDRTPLYIVDRAPGKPFQRIEAPDWLVDDWRSTIMPERQQTLERFQPQREGLNLERGDAFVRGLGLAVTGTTIELPADQLPIVQAALNMEENNAEGFYRPATDIVFTFRSPQLEAINGPGITEKTRIHELVHSNGRQERILGYNGVDLFNYASTEGYITTLGNGAERNLLIGEGVPELVAGDYVADVLGKPYGLADTPNDTCEVWTGHGDDDIRIPSRYVILNGHGELVTNPAGFAAATLDELISRDPALRPALIHGNHDLEARREAIGRIEGIRKGLYPMLRDFFNDDTTFDAGLRYVRDTLGISKT